MLRIRDLEAFYGASQALFGMELSVDAGEVVTLMGRNGMGKTTTVNAIMGMMSARRGVVEFAGQRVDHLPSYRIARLGLGLVPEGRQIFPNLSVRENLLAAAANRGARANPWTIERAFEFFPRLAERQRNMGNQLSGGEQQMLAVGRALILNPRIILLDEPLEGLAPIIVEELLAALKRIIREEGLSAILVEQNAKKILGVTDRAAIIERGGIVHQADSAVLAADRPILEKYLGVADSDRLKRGRGRH